MPGLPHDDLVADLKTATKALNDQNTAFEELKKTSSHWCLG